MIEIKIIAALLNDVATSHGSVFNTRSVRLTTQKVVNRCSREGLSFLTKTLPKLGKAFDKALAGEPFPNSADLGFKPMKDSKLPKFLGELFGLVLDSNGALLPNPCATAVRSIRQVLYLFYKYELPYTHDQEQQVIERFKQTEQDLSAPTGNGSNTILSTASITNPYKRRRKVATTQEEVIREAKILLSRLFASFDPKDIYPRHGPGVVATRQLPWDKYLWTNVSERVTNVYPFDAYFQASAGHVCDHYDTYNRIGEEDLPARVLLVPKDSRGPRLISCEPVDKQWVQQGLGRAIVEQTERHKLTKFAVFFTDQVPNRVAARLGSETGRYATLDLNEASDRVSLDLVRLLFPAHIFICLDACRSSCTELPDGSILSLRKFAPMGSALCFPVMALTIWAILTAAAPNRYTRERIHVYGDDVIVPTAYAATAMEQLESFGLKINRDKSCTKGSFRESCGMDAFKGVDVTPVRLRTVWSSSRSPDVYSSWVAYANSFWNRRCVSVYELIVEELRRIYGRIPAKDMLLACPSLEYVPEEKRPRIRRTNSNLQKLEYRVLDVVSPTVIKHSDGWSSLLRYFAEVANERNRQNVRTKEKDLNSYTGVQAFSVSSYTQRGRAKLVRCWR